MFSFHKPKIYRSISGCCICRAKSSSSRFTDSKKYEAEFEKCFRIDEKRSGEICNACVLLVKRWKKLPTGTNKDWHHVVDARAGPGTKSFKSSKSGSGSSVSDEAKKRRFIKSGRDKLHHLNKRTSNTAAAGRASSTSSESASDDDLEEEEDGEDVEMMMMIDEDHPRLMAAMIDDNDDCCELDGSHGNASAAAQRRSLRRSTRLAGSKTLGGYDGHHRKAFPSVSQSSLKVVAGKGRPKYLRDQFVPFIDGNIWKEEKICCGIIYKGPNNVVLIDPELFQPCRCRSSKSSASSSSLSSTRSSESSMENAIFAAESPSPPVSEAATTHRIATPALIQPNSSGRSTPVLDDAPPALLKPHLEISDDHSSNGGVLCDDNSMQDSISDRLSTVSSSLLDNDDGNISSSSETFDSLHHHTSHAHDLVKNQKSSTTTSLAVV